MTAPALKMLKTRPSLTVFVAEPLIIGVWAEHAPRPEDVTACMASTFQQAKTLKRCALLVAIHPDMPLPDAKVRGVVQAEMKKLDPYLMCGATVLGKDGLVGTAMRAVISTLQLLTRPSHPERIAGSIREAAVFVQGVLAKQMDDPLSVAEIVETYEQAVKQAWKTGQT